MNGIDRILHILTADTYLCKRELEALIKEVAKERGVVLKSTLPTVRRETEYAERCTRLFAYQAGYSRAIAEGFINDKRGVS